MKKFADEFKTFAVKGNMIDLAVGVMVGGAFSKIASSFVNDVAMPIVGIFLGVNFSDWVIELPRLFGGDGEPNLLNLGLFVNTIIDFLIMALVAFVFVKTVNKLRKTKEETPAPPAPSKQEELLSEIRDILKEKNS